MNYEYGFRIFSIVLKSENEVIGEPVIDSSFWNKGLGKETCRALIDSSFHVLQVNILMAKCMLKTNPL